VGTDAGVRAADAERAHDPVGRKEQREKDQQCEYARGHSHDDGQVEPGNSSSRSHGPDEAVNLIGSQSQQAQRADEQPYFDDGPSRLFCSMISASMSSCARSRSVTLSTKFASTARSASPSISDMKPRTMPAQ
jgi:hypothetical protein